MNADRTVELSWHDDVVVVSLARPEAMNSISIELIEDLNWALDEVLNRRPRARALVLTGKGRAFCAGGDISVHMNRPEDAEPHDLEAALRLYFNPLLLRLLNLPIPFVTAVNGAAAGAGFALGICGDVVLVGESARFESGFPAIGLVPDLGLSWFLPNQIGRARAHSVLLLGERVDGKTAAEWGLVNSCVPDGDLQASALKTAQTLARSSIPALVATRKITLMAMGSTLDTALDMEAWEQKRLGFSEDFKEGISAFFGKRSADFKDF